MNNQRVVHYIDVSKMTRKEAYGVLNNIRKKNGLPPLQIPSFLWIPIGFGLIALSNLLITLMTIW